MPKTRWPELHRLEIPRPEHCSTIDNFDRSWLDTNLLVRSAWHKNRLWLDHTPIRTCTCKSRNDLGVYVCVCVYIYIHISSLVWVVVIFFFFVALGFQNSMLYPYVLNFHWLPSHFRNSNGGPWAFEILLRNPPFLGFLFLFFSVLSLLCLFSFLWFLFLTLVTTLSCLPSFLLAFYLELHLLLSFLCLFSSIVASGSIHALLAMVAYSPSPSSLSLSVSSYSYISSSHVL